MTPHLRSRRSTDQGPNAVPVQSAGTASLVLGMMTQAAPRFSNLLQSGQSVLGVSELLSLSSALQDEVHILFTDCSWVQGHPLFYVEQGRVSNSFLCSLFLAEAFSLHAELCPKHVLDLGPLCSYDTSQQ